MVDVQLVRSLYGDMSTDENGDYLFDDETIEKWLILTDHNPYRAAANACRSLASSEAYLNKAVRTADYQIDGAKVASELRLLAENLDTQADRYESDAFEVWSVS